MPSPLPKSSGNAFLYILISVLLLGALTFAISRGNDSNPSGEISDAAAKAAATSILAYESQARTAIDQMVQNGTNVANIDFTLPSDATFNTAPTINKLFHPDGGGLQYKPPPKNASDSSYYSKYFIGQYNNYDWTPSAAKDVVLTFPFINKNVCAELNKKISGSSAFPGMYVQLSHFVPPAYNGTNPASDVTSACSSCVGYPARCVSNGAGSYFYYSILVAR